MNLLHDAHKCDFGSVFLTAYFFQNNIETYVYLEEMMTEKSGLSEKIRKNFSCETCHYMTSDSKDYNKHCSTRKHKMMTNDDHKNNIGEPTHICSRCDKSYKTKQSLWVHKQKCKAPDCNTGFAKQNLVLNGDFVTTNYVGLHKILQKENISMVIHDDTAQPPLHNIIMELLEQNKEFKQTIMDQSNKMMELAQNQNTTINNNKTINNTQFNLNVFLQQTCKDAINMSDFIDSLEINTKSLEHTGTHGYVHGISKIFTDGLRKLKIHERPIHCSDLKREVLYIKDNNKWEKDEENKQFKKALATVVHRNMIQIVKWVSKRSLQPGTAYGGSEEEENPDTSNPESKNYDFYFELVRQSLGGGDQDVTDRNNEKILKAIAQEVHIDRKSAMRTI